MYLTLVELNPLVKVFHYVLVEIIVRLTAVGRRTFRKMARVHEGWVAELLDGVSSEEKEKLIQLLSRLKQQLNQPSE